MSFWEMCVFLSRGAKLLAAHLAGRLPTGQGKKYKRLLWEYAKDPFERALWENL